MSNIYDQLRDWEFNQTEPETLTKLVIDASDKGKELSKEFKRLHGNSKQILEKIMSLKFILDGSECDNIDSNKETTVVGIDGSFQLVGGVGGNWFIPMSVVRILFDKGISFPPKVDIYSAYIEELQEQENYNVVFLSSLKMLLGETKTIREWALSEKRKEKSIIFIDGPIVDPPSYPEKDYVEFRCSSIQIALEKSRLVGCVKKSREKFLIEFLTEKYQIDKVLLNSFPSDQHLISCLFSTYRKEIDDYDNPLFTKLVDVSNYGNNKSYKENGIFIFSFFTQTQPYSRILRVDIPFNTNEIDMDSLRNLSKEYAKIIIEWTLPGQNEPLPIILAHMKCNIRKGCADVLYEEIMTRGIGLSTEDRILLIENLR
ncbi:MAG: DNA double-strand break repair nuclease NurA [Candidatus Heimdallarchaeota archaeon]